MLGRLGRWCHTHRVLVVAVWVLALVGFGAASGAVGNGFTTKFSLPDVESARGFDLLDAHFGGRGSGQTGEIAFESAAGVQDPTVKSAMSAYFDQVSRMPNVSLVSPYTPQGARQISADGKIAYAAVEVPKDLTFTEATN